MKKFDLKKMIAENKATFFSSLNEGIHNNSQQPYNPEADEIDDDDLEAAAEYFDNMEEGKAAYEYEKGKKAGEEIEKKKMKMSELKAKIKEMILAEMTLDVDTMEDAPESEVDFLSELENMLDEKELNPKAKEKEEDTEAAEDVTVDDTETIDTETTAEVDPNIATIQDALTQAQAAAQKLGDEKLLNQIGNTITFFTRTHVVEKPGGALNESIFPILKKILK